MTNDEIRNPKASSKSQPAKPRERLRTGSGPRLCRRPAAAGMRVRALWKAQVAVLLDLLRLVFDTAAVRIPFVSSVVVGRCAATLSSGAFRNLLLSLLSFLVICLL